MTEEITPSVPTAKRAPSIFRSLDGNDACESLHLLTVLPTLAPIRIGARVGSTVSRCKLSQASLPSRERKMLGALFAVGTEGVISSVMEIGRASCRERV